ncbi:hypothetical protein OPT61_g3666 [Boeremia exigua]|uniref:Uncharacterized protein n=1 Tax=Boeremia exigua TaxID=749465 RepID=A0ACC2IH18_9PLEO|nr:hypothetical protein OPT61_g3666 [Boeremia exigua]
MAFLSSCCLESASDDGAEAGDTSRHRHGASRDSTQSSVVIFRAVHYNDTAAGTPPNVPHNADQASVRSSQVSPRTVLARREDHDGTAQSSTNGEVLPGTPPRPAGALQESPSSVYSRPTNSAPATPAVSTCSVASDEFSMEAVVGSASSSDGQRTE